MCNENQHISGFRFKNCVDYVIIYIDIDIHIPKIDSRNMLKDLTQKCEKTEKVVNMQTSLLLFSRIKPFHNLMLDLE